METGNKSEKRPIEKKKIIIISLLGTLGVLLVISLIFIFVIDNTQSVKDSIKDYTFCSGVSIEGTDLSGLTFEQGKAKIEEIDFNDNTEITFTVNGDSYTYEGDKIGISYDLDVVLTNAILYGNAGTLMNRILEKNTAVEKGKDFKLELTLDEEKFRQVLNSSEGINRQAQDATVEFNAEKDDFDPLTDEVFTYHEAKEGIQVDMDQVVSFVKEELKSGDLKTIDVSGTTTGPSVTVEDLKATRQLVSEYSNSYKGHNNDNPNRVYNFTKLAGIICGMTIEPGEEFSMNDRVGPRYASLGWLDAPGLTGGRAVDQPGGGVCQASSCFYMASILAELEVVEKQNHSWPSSYHPAGLDATINTGSPDLVVKNQYSTTIYIVAYVNTKDKTMNVRLYGASLAHGYTVDYVSTKVSNIQPGTQKKIEATEDPDGNAIEPGDQVVWQKRRTGSVWTVTKRYLDADGNVVEEFKNWDTVRYPAFSGIIYYNPESTPVSEDTDTKGTTSTTSPSASVSPSTSTSPST